MPVQVVFNQRSDVVVQDVGTAVEYAADLVLGLGGDRDRLREETAAIARRYGALADAGFIVGMALHLRTVVAERGQTLAVLQHASVAKVGRDTVASRYDLSGNGTSDPVYDLMRALVATEGLGHANAMVSVPVEVEAIAARLRRRCERAVKEASDGRDATEAFALLRSYHDDFSYGRDIGDPLVPGARYLKGLDVDRELEALPARFVARYRAMAAELAPRADMNGPVDAGVPGGGEAKSPKGS